MFSCFHYNFDNFALKAAGIFVFYDPVSLDGDNLDEVIYLMSPHQSDLIISLPMFPRNEWGMPHQQTHIERNIWVEFNALAQDHCEVNLGQGQPDYAPSEYIQKTLADVALEGNDYLQYTREQGHPRLVRAIAALHGPLLGREIDAMNEIIVTHGAYESLAVSFLGLVNPGDEVIIIEPAYDSYAPMTRMAGGVLVTVPLRPRISPPLCSTDWILDPAELRSKFSNKTKLIVLNNPVNPTGKVYTKPELEMIASLCIEFDVICISDEVYEWLIYPGAQHQRIASLQGMFERTVTISSASKSFSVTGWRVGWSIGPKDLIDCLMIAHQNGDCVCTTPAQEAIARCIEIEIPRLDKPECHFNSQVQKLLEKRDRLVAILRESDFVPIVPEAGYFVLADWSKVASQEQIEDNSKSSKDFKFAKWLMKEHKICGIPPTAFCENYQEIVDGHIRFCFFKVEEKLEAASAVFKKIKQS